MKLFRFLLSKTFFANIIVVVLFLLIGYFLLNYGLSKYTRHNKLVEVPDLIGVTLADAESALNERLLAYEVIDSSEFSNEFLPHAIVDQYPNPNHSVKEGRVLRLTVNPKKPRKVKMPDVIQKTLRRAVYDLESKGFQIGELIYKPDIAEDVILGVKIDGEAIEPGTQFEKGAIVDLVVGKGLSAHKIMVPQLIGLTYSQAHDQIITSSLNLGSVLYDEEIKDSVNAQVFMQSPRPSIKPNARVGAHVDIWLTNDLSKVIVDTTAVSEPTDLNP